MQLAITAIENGYLVTAPPKQVRLPDGAVYQADPQMHHCTDIEDLLQFLDDRLNEFEAHVAHQKAMQASQSGENNGPRIIQ